MAGVFDRVSSRDSLGVEIVRNRSVQNAQTWRSCLACRRRSVGRIVMVRRTVRRFFVVCLRLHLRIELAHPLGVPGQRLDRHRAVDEHRQNRDASLFLEPLEPVDQLLDPADREGWNNHAAAARGRAANHLGQLRSVVVFDVHAVAVGRLDEQVVRFRHHRGIRQHGTVEAAEIAAEEDRAAAGADARVGRAEQVPGVDEFHLDVRGHRHRPVVADGLELRDRAKRVGLAVERKRRLVFREAVPVRVRRVLFLDPAGVRKDDAAEVLGAGGAVHAAAEPLRHQPREISAMIEVRVRQDDRVNRRRGNRQVRPVPLAKLLQPLEQAGIDQHLRAASIQQVFRPRNRPRRAEKRDGWHRPLSRISRQRSAAGCQSTISNQANSPTCPPVCQKSTVSFSAKAPRRTYATSPAMALAV